MANLLTYSFKDLDDLLKTQTDINGTSNFHCFFLDKKYDNAQSRPYVTFRRNGIRS